VRPIMIQPPDLDLDVHGTRRSPRFRRAVPGLVVILTLGGLLGFLGPVRGMAQEAPAAAGAAEEATPSASAPLARFVPGKDLVIYAECDGLAAHAEGWEKTAAFKMLTATPLGPMLEEVAGQLLERLLGYLPAQKVTGPEVVRLVETVMKQGWVMAVTRDDSGSGGLIGTLVLRGAAAKEIKPITSRMLGSLMGPDPKPRIERKSGRVVVALPSPADPQRGWVWWPEQEDLVIGFLGPASADAILAAVTGSRPSALAHPAVSQPSPNEGTKPWLRAFIDPSAPATREHPGLGPAMKRLHDDLGITKLNLRLGFDGEALVSVAELSSARPRPPALAIFDQPPIDARSPLPLPEGVDSFLLTSISPKSLIDLIAELAPASEFNTVIEDVLERVRADSRLDLDRDLFGNIGPRVLAYFAPGRSAAATDETAESVLGPGGFDVPALVRLLLGQLPKPTMVAELRDPVAFGRCLDSLMIAINQELKAMAIEEATLQAAAQRTEAGGLSGRGPAPGPAGGQPRRRSPRETPAPEFRLMPGSAKTYMLAIPPESPIKIGPAGFRPTVRVEGNYLVVSTSADSARLAMETVRRSDWKPPADIEQALSKTEPQSLLVVVDDPRDSLPELLASLPGTLQAQINTAIALAAAQPPAGGAAVGGGAGGGFPGPIGGGFGGPGGFPRGSGGSPKEAEFGPTPPGRPGFSGGFPGSSGGGPPPGYGGSGRGFPGGGPPPGYPGSGGYGGSGFPPGSPAAGNRPGTTPQDAMIILQVDPGKLPRAEELRARLFPATFEISADDQTIRLITRSAFPHFGGAAALGPTSASLLAPVLAALREGLESLNPPPAPAAAPGPPGAGGFPPGGPFPGAAPGAPGGGGFPPGGPFPGAAPAPPAGSTPPGPAPRGGRGGRAEAVD